MSRTLKRVPMDFDWPDRKVWKGYLNPFYRECPEKDVTCFNGQTGGREWLEMFLRLLLLAAEESQYTNHPEAQAEFKRRGRSWPHPWLMEMPTCPRSVKVVKNVVTDVVTHPITPDLLDLMKLLIGTGPEGLAGYSCGEVWTLERKLLKMAKLDPKTWGICPVCKGNNLDPTVKKEYDAWKQYEPPVGEGFQLWETCSEGSPVSPVFATLDELCAWCEDNATTFSSFKASAAEWRKMLNNDFVYHQEGNALFM